MHFKILSTICFNWDKSKILSFGKELGIEMLFKPFPKQALVLTCLQKRSFENTVGKGEIARKAISPFPTVFSTPLESFLPFSSNFKLSSASSLNLEFFRFCRLGKG